MSLPPLLVPVLVAAALLLFGRRPATAWWGLLSAAAVLLPGAVVTVTGHSFGPWSVDVSAGPALLVIGAVSAVALAGLPAWSAVALADQRIGTTTVRWYSACCALLPGVMAAGVLLPGRFGLPGALVFGGAVWAVLAGHRRDTTSRRTAATVFAVNLGAALLTLLDPSTGLFSAAGLATLAVWPPTAVWPRTARLLPPAPVAALAVGWPVVALTAVTDRLPDTTTARTTVVVIAALGLLWAAVRAPWATRLRDLLDPITAAGAGFWLLAGPDGPPIAALLAQRLGPAVGWSAAGVVLALTGSPRLATARGLVRRDRAAALGLIAVGPAVALSTIAVLTTTTPGTPAMVAGAVLLAVTVVLTLVTVRAVRGRPDQRPYLTAGPPRPPGSLDAVLLLGTGAALVTGGTALFG